jgi:hypothetical protein
MWRSMPQRKGKNVALLLNFHWSIMQRYVKWQARDITVAVQNIRMGFLITKTLFISAYVAVSFVVWQKHRYKNPFLRYSCAYGRSEMANSTSCIWGSPVSFCAPHCLRLLFNYLIVNVQCFVSVTGNSQSVCQDIQPCNSHAGPKVIFNWHPCMPTITVDILVLLVLDVKSC